jgi:hypothetical protein
MKATKQALRESKCLSFQAIGGQGAKPTNRWSEKGARSNGQWKQSQPGSGVLPVNETALVEHISVDVEER